MLSTSVRLLALGLALSICAAPSNASTRVGIYAIIDDVTFEPSDLDPDRVVIAGTFVVPIFSSGEHARAGRGLLYFSVNPDSPGLTRTDWRALRKAAGTGEVVGFGEYWMPCSRMQRLPPPPSGWSANSNCSLEVNVQDDRTRATAEPYPKPSSEGVVTVFDHEDDICPRFGRPSVQIVAELRAVHSPAVAESQVPICDQSVVASSALEWTFRTQTRDAEWASGAEALILRRLTEARGLALSDLGVECRDTICQIRLAFPSREYQDAKGNRLAADALQELPGFAPGAAIVPSETNAAIVYYVQRRKPSLTHAAASAQH